jgi:hypothetical protein
MCLAREKGFPEGEILFTTSYTGYYPDKGERIL